MRKTLFTIAGFLLLGVAVFFGVKFFLDAYSPKNLTTEQLGRAAIEVQEVSLDGGETYRGPLKEVSGDLANVPAGYNHSITWHVLREFGTDAFESDQVRFKLSVKLKEKWYKETFITFNGAYSFLPQASFGFSVGQVKHFGWFVSVMSNGNFSGFSHAVDCDGNGYTSEGYLPSYTGEKSKMRLSVMGGGVMRLSGPLCARVGVGYGNRTMRWQVNDCVALPSSKALYVGDVSSTSFESLFIRAFII